MADVIATRKGLVQTMRKSARECGVGLIRDVASREKVKEFVGFVEGFRKTCKIVLKRKGAHSGR